MLPVFMILHSKIYFMRAPARQRKYRIKEFYRQTERNYICSSSLLFSDSLVEIPFSQVINLFLVI